MNSAANDLAALILTSVVGSVDNMTSNMNAMRAVFALVDGTAGASVIRVNDGECTGSAPCADLLRELGIDTSRTRFLSRGANSVAITDGLRVFKISVTPETSTILPATPIRATPVLHMRTNNVLASYCRTFVEYEPLAGVIQAPGCRVVIATMQHAGVRATCDNFGLRQQQQLETAIHLAHRNMHPHANLRGGNVLVDDDGNVHIINSLFSAYRTHQSMMIDDVVGLLTTPYAQHGGVDVRRAILERYYENVDRTIDSPEIRRLVG